jgi:uncharacterized RDD family membrane protein YckC
MPQEKTPARNDTLVPDSSMQSSAALPYIYLLYANQNHGPYVLDQIRNMWSSGIVTADAMYRTEGETEWTPITNLLAPEYSQTVQHIESPVTGIPSQGAATARVPVQSEKAERWNASEPRPWRRLWARFLDLFILGGIPALIFASIWLYLFPNLGYVAFPAIVFAPAFESWLLSTYGTTPSKWLLGISVREADGRKLTPLHAQQRALSATWRSAPMWFPLFGLLAYRDLKKKKATRWDKKGRYVVTYAPISGARWFASLSLFFVFIAATVIIAGDFIGRDQRIIRPTMDLAEKTADLKLAQRDLKRVNERAQREAAGTDAASEVARAKSKAMAIERWPDVADDTTMLGKAVAARIAELKDPKHPDHALLFADSAPLIITRGVADELGIAPVQAKRTATEEKTNDSLEVARFFRATDLFAGLGSAYFALTLVVVVSGVVIVRRSRRGWAWGAQVAAADALDEIEELV